MDGQVGDFGEHGGGGVAEAKIGTDASADCRGPKLNTHSRFANVFMASKSVARKLAQACIS